MFFVLSLSSQTTKVNVLNRVIAKVMDLLLVIMVGSLVPRPFGPLLGFAYSLLADGMNFGPFQGQSVGKKLMGLRVVNIHTKKPATLRESLLRNSPVGVATFFAIIPLWGWVILFLIGLPLMAMEVYLMITVETGHRLGDVMGDTAVAQVNPKAEERP